jgi:hypothetical protein
MYIKEAYSCGLSKSVETVNNITFIESCPERQPLGIH